ncbi:MAG: hypothetical protein HC818_02155 [Synechococcaceae cyanobacterium RM1_1_27]|nr:hypothetical protein [Synechococcaceae cyanobacterium SM2_3_2]NJO85613.1 hypothetical protein [Synechococcaceae cyanobacterium RM1_1_27]
MDPEPALPSAQPQALSSPVAVLNTAELEAFEQRVQLLQQQVTDLKSWSELEQVSPSQWADMQSQIQALEERMNGYLVAVIEDINQPPAAFWQAVRFGGIGIVVGILLQRWLA